MEYANAETPEKDRNFPQILNFKQIDGKLRFNFGCFRIKGHVVNINMFFIGSSLMNCSTVFPQLSAAALIKFS